MRGFSLVELSIVLVILGLLTGGILAGQSLIRASELRAVTSESQRYITAIQSFRDKYQGWPGDLNNATQFWGRLNGNADCVTYSSAAVASPGACDGNGNNLLGLAGGGSQSGEIFQFFRHLALAGLIEGSYSGLSGAANGYTGVAGTNLPVSKLTNGVWHAYYYTNVGDSANWAIEHGNFIGIGASQTNTVPQGAVMKPEEAWNIDSKLDDGLPARGKVIAPHWNDQCSSADDGTSAKNDLAASYRLSVSSIQCNLYFIKQF